MKTFFFYVNTSAVQSCKKVTNSLESSFNIKVVSEFKNILYVLEYSVCMEY